jgi:NTE family protein
VLRVDRRRLLGNVLRWGAQLLSGGAGGATVDALLDNSPLRRLLLEHLRVDTGGWLTGIADKLSSRRLEALAITATNYGSGRAETFVESSLDASSQVWSRSYRIGRPARLSVDHVMASSAIPVLFPPVELGGCWYGDGGVRQTAPLSPALRLGADRMLVISTTRGPADVPDGPYPRPSVARVLGVVANALLNDHSEYDAAHLARISRLLQASPQSTWGQLRPVSLLYIRPSQDLGALAAAHEATLPLALRHLLRGWGGSRAQSSDLLSTVLFEGAYTRELIACGRRDAEAHLDRVLELIGPSVLAR